MLEKFPAVYQGEIEEKCAPKARRKNFGGKMGVFKGENAQKHTFLWPNRYFFRDPNLRKIKPPGYFFRDPNLRKIKTPDDFPDFQTLRGGSRRSLSQVG